MMIRKWLAVGIMLLFVGTCIIPATAIENESSSQIPSKASKMLSYGNEIYPQIHLTKSHLPMLAKAIASLNNTFYKTILQQIRWSLERKSSLDGEELRMMINTMGITNISFFCGYMSARGETGHVTIFPFTFFALFLYSIKHIYIGPILIGMWFTNWESTNHNWEGVSFSINGREVIQGATSGIAVGGFGVFYRMSFEKPEFDFVGLFPLIIVNNNPL